MDIEPRIGISWRPIPASTLVVRAGYGIYDDTSVYLTAAESMADAGAVRDQPQRGQQQRMHADAGQWISTLRGRCR